MIYFDKIVYEPWFTFGFTANIRSIRSHGLYSGKRHIVPPFQKHTMTITDISTRDDRYNLSKDRSSRLVQIISISRPHVTSKSRNIISQTTRDMHFRTKPDFPHSIRFIWFSHYRTSLPTARATLPNTVPRSDGSHHPRAGLHYNCSPTQSICSAATESFKNLRWFSKRRKYLFLGAGVNTYFHPYNIDRRPYKSLYIFPQTVTP